MRNSLAIKDYSKIQVSKEALDVSEAELILKLYEKSCWSLLAASKSPINEMETLGTQERVDLTAAFYEQTGNALQIIIALRDLLDLEQGGDIAQSLYSSYTAIANVLAKASRDKKTSDLAKLYSAMSELKDAWMVVCSSEKDLSN